MITSTVNYNNQSGFSYIEMVVATVIVMASLGPVINSLQSARLSAELHALDTQLHYRVMARAEDVLAEPFGALIDAAATAGNAQNASSYSDTAGQVNRIVVNLSFYDIADADADGDFFTIADNNQDLDDNPYTGTGAAIEMAWIRVSIPGTSHVIESLSKR